MAKTNTIQAIFLLDESGSMNTVKKQVISGFYEYLRSLKERKDKVKFTLTLFNSDKIEHRYISKNIKKVEDLTEENYQPDMLTPLYDAIVHTIKAVEKAVGKDDIVLFAIQTDGMENFSKECEPKLVGELIKEKQDAGWEFVFLGADQDAFLASNAIGIHNSINYESRETFSTLTSLAQDTNQYLDRKQADPDAKWDQST
jgi:hypothetical protein